MREGERGIDRCRWPKNSPEEREGDWLEGKRWSDRGKIISEILGEKMFFFFFKKKKCHVGERFAM